MTFQDLEIKPNVGLGDLLFGMKIKPFIEKFGEPEELENIDEDEDLNTTILHYWTKGLSAFFYGLTDQVLAGIECDDPNIVLFGKKILGKSEDKIVNLMKKHGHESYEVEMEGPDKRLSFDISMMDFFFRNGKLAYMNFGVLIDEQGQIEPV
jgi:hypothetical protein